jgi:O-Antigen ligase
LSTAYANHVPSAGPHSTVLSTRALRNFSVWLLFASGFMVFIEPAPFEIAFAVLFVTFVLTGLRFSVLLVPLILPLLIYNIGGGLSLMGVAEEERAIWFIVISVYMAVMSIVVACVFAEDTLRRLELMKSGYVLAATIASICGIMGYFDIAGTFDLFTRYGRAMGPFKDPNVYSTFLALPLVLLIQGFFLGTHKRPVFAFFAFLIIAAGLFLSFSRGAWGVTVGATLMCIGLTFVTERSGRMRLRIVAMMLLGVAFLTVLLIVALQFEGIRETFETRASLNQDYDGGETGRFGAQRRSIPMLLDLPNGFGPTLFRDTFGNDPHNTYINAFAAYGWMGGIAYFGLITATVLAGFSLVFRRSPWQRESIACWSALFLLILQGFQIDTDHWRHFYVQMGLTWGLMLATVKFQASSPAAPMRTTESPPSRAQTDR